jgi:hypothetical protein
MAGGPDDKTGLFGGVSGAPEPDSAAEAQAGSGEAAGGEAASGDAGGGNAGSADAGQAGVRPTPASRHSYLVRPGLWSVEGLYLDRDEGRHLQTGQLVIVHGTDLWTIDSELTITGADARRFTSRYEVTPLAEGAAQTEWKSEVGGPEPVYGLFVLVEDALMMPWQSRSGAYWGHETLLRAGTGVYVSRGFAFLRREKVSSWAVKLTWQGGSLDEA